MATYNLFTVGGTQVNGTFGGRFLFNEGSGGVRTGGGVEEYLAFWNPLRDREYLFDVGDIVYVQDPRANRPSRYHRHVVEGYRYFGEHNLYDIGIGILIEESFLVSDLTHDVIVSDEAIDTWSYANYKQDKLDNISPSSDPVGGSLDNEEIDSVCCVKQEYGSDLEREFAQKLEALSETSVLPPPTGGIMAFSQRDGDTDVDVSSVQDELESLENIAILPSPTGAYIIVSTETEPVATPTV